LGLPIVDLLGREELEGGAAVLGRPSPLLRFMRGRVRYQGPVAFVDRPFSVSDDYWSYQPNASQT
jgi:hypothetical protein